jgi:multidrug efflux system membrane fusion protein
VVSVNAVQITRSKKYAFVLRDTKVERRPIETGAEIEGGEILEVRSGLQPGDEVVIAGADGLSDGTTVRVVRDINPYTGEKVASAPVPAGSAPAKKSE